MEIRPWGHHTKELFERYTPGLERQLPCAVTGLSSAEQCDAELRNAEVLALWYRDQLAGVVGLTAADQHAIGWCWYWVFQDFRSRGIASAALCVVANAALSTQWYRLEIGYQTNNSASARVAETAGFIVEGYERQKFIWGDTRVDAVLAARLATDPWPQPKLTVELSSVARLLGSESG